MRLTRPRNALLGNSVTGRLSESIPYPIAQKAEDAVNGDGSCSKVIRRSSSEGVNAIDRCSNKARKDQQYSS